MPGTVPLPADPRPPSAAALIAEWPVPASSDHVQPIRLLLPTAGLHVAHDPRIPAEFEALPMRIEAVPELRRTEWYIDGELAASTADTTYPWPLRHGTHRVKALVWTADSAGARATEDVRFYVH